MFVLSWESGDISTSACRPLFLLSRQHLIKRLECCLPHSHCSSAQPLVFRSPVQGFPGVSSATIAAETLRGAQTSCLNLPVNWYFHRGLRQTFQISQFPLLKNQSDNSSTKRNTQRQWIRRSSLVFRHAKNTEQKVRWRWAVQFPLISDRMPTTELA